MNWKLILQEFIASSGLLLVFLAAMLLTLMFQS